MAEIRLKKITVENAPFIIGGGQVNITDTSVNSVTLSGGLVVQSTEQSTSNTNGCSVISGGVGIMKNVQVGGDIVGDNTTGVFRMRGISVDRVLVDTTLNNNIKFSADGINTGVELTDTFLKLNVSTNSTNSTTAALVVVGGISIGSTNESTSITSGGGITNLGGLSVLRNVNVGGGISSLNSNTIGNLITRTDGNVGIGTSNPNYVLDVNGMINSNTGISTSNLWAINVSSNNIVITNTTTTNLNVTNTTTTNLNVTNEIASNITSSTLYINNVGNLSFNSNTLGSIITTGGNVGVGVVPTYTMDISGDFRTVQDINSEKASVFENSHSGGSALNMIRLNNDSGSGILFLNSSTRTLDGGANVFTIRNDTGHLRLQAENAVSTLFLNTNGNIGINTTSPGTELDIIGRLRVSGDLTTANVYTTNITTTGLITSNLTSNNILATNISTTSLNVSTYINISAGSWTTTNGDDIYINANNNTINLRPTTNSAANSVIISNTQTLMRNNNNTNAFILDKATDTITLAGTLNVNSTVNAVGLGSGGNLTILGGGSISRDMYIGGKTRIYSTEVSNGYTSGAVILSGGLTITGNNNAVNSSNGGDLTVQGGGAFGGDLYIAGSINGSSSSSTFAYLNITGTDAAINRTTGSIITVGGITIQCSVNSSSVTNGGALLVLGGAAVEQDIYIGENQFNYGRFDIKSNVNNVFNFYDTLDIKGISVDYDNSSRDFSISRYDTNSVFIERTIDISNSTGIITLSNSTPSSSNNSAALVIEGGTSINCTVNASSLTNGGGLSILGGTSIAKDLLLGGDLHIYSTRVSNDASSGALIVDGGAAIKGNFNVLGNTVINGDLTVSGTSTNVESTNTTITDNIVVLNSGPAGSKDSGFIVNRYQIDNDTGSCDVVNDQLYTLDTLPLQGGVSSTEIKLSTGASVSDDYYIGWWIKVTSGFNNNQVRKITDYDGTTKVATISSAWTTQNPTNGDTVFLYNKPYVGLIYNEINDRFELGSSVNAATSGNITFTSNLPLYLSEITLNSTKNANNVTSGSIISNGGLLLLSTANSSSLTDGGALLVLGGGSINKDFIIGGELVVNSINVTPNTYDIVKSKSFAAANNVGSASDITGLLFVCKSIDVYLVAELDATSELYANFHIRGVKKSSSWEIIKSYIGDDMGIEFYITSGGQLQYTSSNYSGFVSLNFSFRAITN